MQNVLSLNSPLQTRLYNSAKTSLLQKIVLVMIGNLLLALSAKISIPLTPVPVTMQTLAVLLIGMSYGWRLGSITVLAYLIEGLVGMPVLASALNVTWGYLFGFLFAAAASGWLVERGFGRYRTTTFLAGMIGMLIIYACGVVGLTQYADFDLALTLGVKPFLLIDTLKVVFVSAVIPCLWKTRQ